MIAKTFGALPLVAVAAFGTFALASTAARADSVVVVSPGNMGDWTFVNRDPSGTVTTPTTGQMVNGPASPPAGTGSANLNLPANNGGSDSALRSTGFAGIALDTLTTLQYSTYDTANNGSQFPYFGLVVAAKGTVYDTVFFEPPYQQPSTGNPTLPDQGAPVQGQWQTWNALAGAWWDNNGLSQPGNGPGHSLSFDELLAAIAAQASIDTNTVVTVADLTIANTDDGSGNTLGGVRFDVGFADPDPAYNGYVDAFKIGVNGTNTTYDFEATAAATPLPAALPMFGSALGFAGILGWRRKRKAAANAGARA